MWTPLLLGLSIGVLLTLPIAAVWSRFTERRVRELERRARSAERLAELGTLTSGLAHEIKNPLSTVGLNMQLLQEDLGDIGRDAPPGAIPEEKLGRMQRRFDALRRETSRLRDILEDFLRFAGRMELDRTPTDLNALVDELADFYEPQAAAAHVNQRRQLGARPAVVPIDAGLVKQALLNLLINATQAMATAREKGRPHGGADELLLRTQNRRYLGRDEVEICVTDTGPGITPDVVEKVFQPYFSTKRGGTGLGLPTSRRIAEEHGGRLTVHSEPGRGTEFTIALPTEVEAVDAEPATPGKHTLTSGPGARRP